MSPTLQLGRALSYGADGLATRGGAVLVGLYAALQFGAQVVSQSLFADLYARVVPADALPPGTAEQAYPLALGIPLGASVALVLLFTLASVVLTVLAVRALYADVDAFPADRHTRRLGRTVAVAFVVSVVVSAAILVGSLLVLPGLFLAVALVFAHAVVALEDAGVVESLRRSWSLTSGNRLRLFGLGVVVVVAAGVVGGLFGLVGGLIPVPLAGPAVASVGIGLASVFSLATLVGAYVQLAGEPERPVDGADAGTAGR